MRALAESAHQPKRLAEDESAAQRSSSNSVDNSGNTSVTTNTNNSGNTSITTHPLLQKTRSERHNRSTSRPKMPQRSNSLSSLYPLTPISSYYTLNDSILQAFDSLYLQKKYKVAYAMGLQFIETALLEIPRHGYFYSPKHTDERKQSSLEAERVCKLLQELVGQEEQEEKERLEKLRQLAQKQRVATKELQDDDSWSDLVVCGDAIQHYLCPIPEQQKQEEVPFDEELPQKRRSKREKEVSIKHLKLDEAPPKQVVEDEATKTQSVLFEPPEEKRIDQETRPETKSSWDEPPYYQESLSATESAELERALFLSGLDVRQQASFDDTHQQHGPPTKPPGEIDVGSLKFCFREDFYESLNSGRVRISRITTWQGRLVGSINGCTVIAPLLCIHHFQNELDDANWPDPGLPDAALEHVIDEETCGMLPQVREELGLTKDALIIPSDVHDFLLDRGLLMQQQFVTVCGGNILNEVHLQEMVNCITNVPEKFQGKKIAATVFFHEHVVAILKLDRGQGTFWFDLIDSLPYEDTMNAQSAFSTPEQQDWAFDEDYVPYAARIRCLDVDALRATLRWYAVSKFNEKDCSYIDSYAWEDDKSDFDPRVFQAFVWAEA